MEGVGVEPRFCEESTRSGGTTPSKSKMATALLSVASLVAALFLPPTLRPPPLQLQRIPTAVPLATAASAAPARCHPPRLALQDSVIQFDFDDEEEEEDDDDDFQDGRETGIGFCVVGAHFRDGLAGGGGAAAARVSLLPL